MSKPNILTPEFIRSKSTPVPETGCWLWAGFIRRDGYGHLRSFNKKILAHRASYVAHNGAISGDILVRHTCDVRSCVNPEHLELGTTQDNIDDRNKRARTARGLKVPRAKLSDDDVRFIRQSLLDDKELALRFGVQKNYVTRIKDRRERPYVD